MVKASVEVVKNSEGRIESGTITIQRRKVQFNNQWDENGLLRQIDFEGKTIPTISELYSFINQKFIDRVTEVKSQPFMEDLTRQEWISDGSYTERWEQGFRKILYHGRTGAYFESESMANTPYKDWTLPQILVGDSDVEPDPYKNVLRLRNTKDGVIIDRVYVGFPKGFMRGVICFDAKLPSVGQEGMVMGLEVNSGGFYALIMCLRWDVATAGWMLQMNQVPIGAKESVTINNPDVYAHYALEYDPPYFKLYQSPALDPDGYPILTNWLRKDAVKGKAIPFFCNEQPTTLCEYSVGNIWIYELPENSAIVTSPTIFNVTMANANTEYSQALPPHTKRFSIKTRDGTAFRIAFVTGKVAAPTAPYLTVPANVEYSEDSLNVGFEAGVVIGAGVLLTLYFGCGVAAKVVEIIAWS